MTITEANDVNTVLYWAMGRARWHGGHVSDEDATEAGRRLAAKAYKTLSAGLLPRDVDLVRAATVQRLERIMEIAGLRSSMNAEPVDDIGHLAEILHAEHHPGTFVPSLDSCTEHDRADYEARVRAMQIETP